VSNKTENIPVPKGDYGYKLNFTLKDDDGTVQDLTSYTMTLKTWLPGVPDTLIKTGTCGTENAASASVGKCYYSVASGDFDTVERYLYEIEKTKAGTVESAQNGWLTVEESG